MADSETPVVARQHRGDQIGGGGGVVGDVFGRKGLHLLLRDHSYKYDVNTVNLTRKGGGGTKSEQ